MVSGAAIAAAFHSTSGLSYQADAVIVIPSDQPRLNGARRVARWRLLSAGVRQPAVAASAQRRGVPGTPRSLVSKVEVRGDPVSGLLVVRARDSTPAGALAIANAFAQAGVEFAEDAYRNEPGSIAATDFEGGLREWDVSHSALAVAPGALSLTTGAARFNDHAVRVSCSIADNCGTTATVDYAFRRGELYTASGWVRSVDDASRIRLYFGTISDAAEGRERQPGSTWRRITVSWRPRQNTGAAYLAVARSGREPATFHVDGVAIWEAAALEEPPERPLVTREREERLFDEVPTITAFPARSIGSIGPSGPVPWALIGAAAGLLVGLAGIGAGRAAVRRDRGS